MVVKTGNLNEVEGLVEGFVVVDDRGRLVGIHLLCEEEPGKTTPHLTISFLLWTDTQNWKCVRHARQAVVAHSAARLRQVAAKASSMIIMALWVVKEVE